MTTMASPRTGPDEPDRTPYDGKSDAAGSKMIYYFGKSQSEGDSSQKQLLGGKGANLAEMSSLGLPVPPGFTITTKVCAAYYDSEEKLPDGLTESIAEHIRLLETETGQI